jgi:hypothetical protein
MLSAVRGKLRGRAPDRLAANFMECALLLATQKVPA